MSLSMLTSSLRNGQQYDLVVTATNKYGESLKEKQNIKRIRVLGGIIIKKYKLIGQFLISISFL